LAERKGKYIFEQDSEKKIDTLPDIKISVVTSLKSFKDFFKMPWVVYENDNAWVPPLWEEMKDFFKSKLPFWKHAEIRLFTAYKDGVACGRIAAVIDHLFIKEENENIGFFGFFEVIEDYDIASALLNTAKKWLKDKAYNKALPIPSLFFFPKYNPLKNATIIPLIPPTYLHKKILVEGSSDNSVSG